MKKVFVLTETDSTDASWCYNEVFEKKGDAVSRLHEMYHEDVVEREELVVKSEFTDEKAYAEMADGIIIAWNIKETEVKPNRVLEKYNRLMAVIDKMAVADALDELQAVAEDMADALSNCE